MRFFLSGLAALALACSLPALAQQHEEHGQRGHDEHAQEHARADTHRGAATPRGDFHGEIGRFHEHDWAVWHGGQWVHGDHGPRHGWWWVAGGIWYFYPAPIYPYPNPYEPPMMSLETPSASEALPPPPTPTNWYYCDSAGAYYPYVDACPEGWRSVPAAPATGSAPPAPPPPGTP